jgi:hypothetical protein
MSFALPPKGASHLVIVSRDLADRLRTRSKLRIEPSRATTSAGEAAQTSRYELALDIDVDTRPRAVPVHEQRPTPPPGIIGATLDSQLTAMDRDAASTNRRPSTNQGPDRRRSGLVVRAINMPQPNRRCLG